MRRIPFYSLVLAVLACLSTPAFALPVSFLSEDFETFAQGSTAPGGSQTLINGWLNDTTDNLDWIADVGGTPTSSTGPSVDFGPGTSSGKYLYVESSVAGTGYSNKIANLLSPILDLTSRTNTGVSFAYHMFGISMGSLHFDTSIDGGATFSNDIMTAITGNQGNQWFTKTIDLSAFDGQSQFRLRLRGITGTSFRSDMAVDDFSFFEEVSAGPAVPEPATATLMGLGLLCMASYRWRRRHKTAA